MQTVSRSQPCAPSIRLPHQSKLPHQKRWISEGQQNDAGSYCLQTKQQHLGHVNLKLCRWPPLACRRAARAKLTRCILPRLVSRAVQACHQVVELHRKWRVQRLHVVCWNLVMWSTVTFTHRTTMATDPDTPTYNAAGACMCITHKTITDARYYAIAPLERAKADAHVAYRGTACHAWHRWRQTLAALPSQHPLSPYCLVQYRLSSCSHPGTINVV